MRKSALLVVVILVLSSCATVLNRSTKTIYITTTTPAKVVVNKDTLRTFQDKIPVEVQRQSTDLKITVFSDSVTKKVLIKPRNSFMFWLNAYPTPLLWTGFLIDKKNPKRYTYPTRMYFDMKDTTNTYLSYDPRSKKGEIDLRISLPHINNFLLKPDNESNYKLNTGFWGLTVGLDYYHSAKQFINLSATGVMDFFLPIPAAVDMAGYYEIMNSTYFSVSNNHKIKNFTVGYGLCYVKNTWNLNYSDWGDEPLTVETVSKSNNAIGFIFPAYYMPSEHFFIGVVYRPTLFRLSTENPFKYEHLISIDFGWKIKLKK
jgi:hypothetical protein